MCYIFDEFTGPFYAGDTDCLVGTVNFQGLCPPGTQDHFVKIGFICGSRSVPLSLRHFALRPECHILAFDAGYILAFAAGGWWLCRSALESLPLCCEGRISWGSRGSLERNSIFALAVAIPRAAVRRAGLSAGHKVVGYGEP
jgi:hypothetical protein